MRKKTAHAPGDDLLELAEDIQPKIKPPPSKDETTLKALATSFCTTHKLSAREYLCAYDILFWLHNTPISEEVVYKYELQTLGVRLTKLNKQVYALYRVANALYAEIPLLRGKAKRGRKSLPASK